MDMTQHAGGLYLRAEDIRERGPKRVKIERIEDGQFGKPVLVLNDGTSLTLNKTNTRTLVGPYGRESRDWIDREIELYIGPISYEGHVQDSILVRPISPPIPLSERRPLKPVKPVPKPPIDDDDAF
jgi:hypothetical protein